MAFCICFFGDRGGLLISVPEYPYRNLGKAAGPGMSPREGAGNRNEADDLRRLGIVADDGME
jgi:hypothetical protein